MADILLVEDEDNARKILAMGLEMHGHHVVGCATVEEAEVCMNSRCFDVILTDLRMQGCDAGLDVIRLAQKLQPESRSLLLTAYASTDTAVAAIKEGAFDYLTKPVSSEELAAAVERALADGGELPQEADVSVDALHGEPLLIGHSELMQRVKSRLMRAAQSDFTVLISGESGTGKELAARFLHLHSSRCSSPFVPVHCGAIPEGLFESELFGHRKGAFTGADFDRQGLVESANGGTLFLDEVGEMPLSAQVKLLRVLQEKRIRRVGEDHERDVNIRVVAASNRDLHAEVRQGSFREDLFFRLNVVPVHMPPLRLRSEDIPELAEAIVRRWSEGRVRITADCMVHLCRLPLAGNVRELENILQRMLALSDGDDLALDLLLELYDPPPQQVDEVGGIENCSGGLDAELERVEKAWIEQALQASGGNVTKAAKTLGISFRSLRYRLKKLEMADDE